MTYCVYKINVQPDIIESYRKDNELDYLIQEAIPNSFETVLQVNEIKGYYELIVEENSTKVDFLKEFGDLENLTKDLIKMYNEILRVFDEEKEIYYSKKFLTLNDYCGNKRRNLEMLFPGIKKAYDMIDDQKIEREYNLVTSNQVGTSITHIKKFYKLKLFMTYEEAESTLEPLNLISYYNPNTEHLLIKTNNEELASNYVQALLRLINENEEITKNIGKININPIYDSVEFEGDFTEIRYTIVYPNGNPPLNRDNILRDSQAKEQEVTLIGTDGRALKMEPVKKLLEEEAKKGYLKAISAKGSKFISVLKKVSKLDLDVTE